MSLIQLVRHCKCNKLLNWFRYFACFNFGRKIITETKYATKKSLMSQNRRFFFHFLFHCRLYSHKYELSQHHLFWILSHFHSRIRSILISSNQFAILSRRNNVAIEHAHQNIMCTHNCVLFLNRKGKKIRWS